MPGIYTGTDLADKSFYGFRLSISGNLSVEVIRGESPIVLPQEEAIDPNDYKTYVWSDNDLSFEWGPNGHIYMKML
jgi:hypothetical protein